MSDEDSTTPPNRQPRVVKKVVKRTVVRPSSTPTSRSSAQRSSAQGSSAQRTSRPIGIKTADAEPKTPAAPTESKRGAIDLGRIRSTSRQWTDRGARGAAAGVGGLRSAVSATGNFVADRYWDVRSYRLPPQPPPRAAAMVGAMLGLFAVVVGWIAGLVFTQVRGTSSGGGLWGGLVVAALLVFAVWAGTRLLRSLAVEYPGTVSLLAVFLALIVVLLLLIDIASGPWAWLVVPLLGTACYALAQLLTTLATTDEETA